MNKFLLICILLTTSLSAFAQIPNTESQAKAILNKVSATYKSYKNLQAEFTQIVVNPHAKSNDKLTGTVFIKGQKFKLLLNNQEIICDNQTIWTFNKTSNEVQINNYEPSPGDINPTNVFNIYEKGFSFAMNSEKVENGKSIIYVDLTPIDKSKPYFKVRLSIDKAANIINGAVFMFKDGKTYTFQIGKIVPNGNITDALFTFDAKAHPGVSIENLK